MGQALLIALRAVIGVMEIVLVLRVLFELKVKSKNIWPFKFLVFVSEPLLNPVRKILSEQAKEKKLKFDVSPLVSIILLYLISTLIKRYIQ